MGYDDCTSGLLLESRSSVRYSANTTLSFSALLQHLLYVPGIVYMSTTNVPGITLKQNILMSSGWGYSLHVFFSVGTTW